jgi:hypothetical protein
MGIPAAARAAAIVSAKERRKIQLLQVADLKSAQKHIPFLHEIRPNQTPNCPEPLTKVRAGINIHK